MPLVIDPRLEDRVREKVSDGGYRDADAVIGEAMRLLDERDRQLQRLREELAVGVAQAERGEVFDFTPELLDRLSLESEENARRGKPVKDAVKP